MAPWRVICIASIVSNVAMLPNITAKCKCPFTGGLDLRAHGPLTGVADLIKPAW
jgi:hypothetical protein